MSFHYLENLIKIAIKATEQIITLADQCQVDRDEAYKLFAAIVLHAEEEATFKSYEVKKPSNCVGAQSEGKEKI